MLTAESAERAAQKARERAKKLENFRARYWRYVESRGHGPEFCSKIGVLFEELYGENIEFSLWGDQGAPVDDQIELQAEIDDLRAFAERAERYANDLYAADGMEVAS